MYIETNRQYSNISLSEVIGNLPQCLSTVPEWLKVDKDTMIQEIESVVHLEERKEDFSLLVQLRSGIYLYVDYYEGTGSYDCCRSLQVTFSSSWELIKPHLVFKSKLDKVG